ncbi:hypothetical protein PIB30_096831, partial [Stylosanthes scabra]|nr:hypothetical protein [Stylosanthes scabra]
MGIDTQPLGIDTQAPRRPKPSPRASSNVTQVQDHARTLPPPRLAVGFHHSPRLGVAGKPKARHHHASAWLGRPNSTMTAPGARPSVSPAWPRSLSHAWIMPQHGSS